MICPQCDQNNLPGTAYCSRCGTRLAGPPDAATGGLSAGRLSAGGYASSDYPAGGYAGATAWAAVPETAHAAYAADAAPLSATSATGTSSSLVSPTSGRALPAVRPLGRFAPPSTPLTGAVARRVRRAPTGTLDAIFGPDALVTAAPTNRVQVAMRLLFGARQAPGKWAYAIVGAVVAAITSLVVMGLALALWDRALAQLADPTAYGLEDSTLLGRLGSALEIVKTFLSADLLKMLTLAQGVPVASASGSPVSSLSLPLTGFLLVPALALTLGGWTAGAGDARRQVRYAVARGALIAPFYAIFLGFCAFLSASPGASGPVSPSLALALLLGLVWGLVFGALGGWLRVAGAKTLSGVLPTLRSTGPNTVAGRVRGAIAGGVMAVGSGLLVSLVVCLAGLAFLAVRGSALAPAAGSAGAPPLAQLGQAFALALSLGPVAAVWAFSAATGAPFVVASHDVLSAGVTRATFGLIGATNGPPAPFWDLIALVPAICFLFGGRVAARASGARTAGAGLVAGTLTAVPASLVLAAAAYLSTLRYTVQTPSAAPSITLTVGPEALYVLASAFVLAAVFGALGGVSVVSAPALGGVPGLLALPLRPLTVAFDPLLDRLTGQSRGQARGATRRWLYDAAVAAVVFAAVTVILTIAGVVGARTLPYQTWALVTGIAAALAIGVPVLFSVFAVLTAIASPPEGTRPVGEVAANAVIIDAPPIFQVYATSSAGASAGTRVP